MAVGAVVAGLALAGGASIMQTRQQAEDAKKSRELTEKGVRRSNRLAVATRMRQRQQNQKIRRRQTDVGGIVAASRAQSSGGLGRTAKTGAMGVYGSNSQLGGTA